MSISPTAFLFPSRSSLDRLRLLFVSLCLAFAPVEVVDLLGNSGGFRLTPFLLLSILYVFVIVLEQSGAFARRKPLPSFLLMDASTAAALFFIVLIWTSALFRSVDSQELVYPRATYTSWLVLFAIIFVARERVGMPLKVAWAARVYIVADLFAVLAQVLSSLQGWSLPGMLATLAPQGVAGLLRPGGLVADPNRSSMVLISFMALAYASRNLLPQYRRVGGGYYILGTLLAIVTISRTGIAALGIFGAIVFFQSQRKMRIMKISALTVLLVGAALATYLVASGELANVAEQANLVLFASEQRQTSNTEHVALITRGLDEFLLNPKRIIIGAGWGSEYEFTKEFFGDSKYGNFHCEFVSVAVQNGVLGLLCILFLILRPAFLRLRWWMLTPIIFWSCIFYEYHGDPFWWITLLTINTVMAAEAEPDPVPVQREAVLSA